MPQVPAISLPTAGAFGYAATSDPTQEQTTHALAGGGSSASKVVTTDDETGSFPNSQPLGTNVHMSGTFAALPAAGVSGRYYDTTDTFVRYRDNGVAWVAVGAGLNGSGLIPTAQHATGVANSSSVLRGDSTWASRSGIDSTAIHSGDAAAGSLAGTYPNPTLTSIITAGTTQGDASHTQVLSWTVEGRLTAVTNTAISGAGIDSTAIHTGSAAGGDLTGTYPNPTLSGTANVESIIRANSLDQFAAAAANVSLGNNKIINLTNGSASTDAATWGQAVIAAGKAGGQTIDGGTAASENLTLQSTANATRGVILINDVVDVVNGGTATYTAALPTFVDLSNTSTYTLNFASAGCPAGVKHSATYLFQQSAFAIMASLFQEGATYKNVTTVAASLGGLFAFSCTPTFQTDGATITFGSSVDFFDNVTYGGITSGTGSGGGHVSFKSSLTINSAAGSSVTLASRTGYTYSDVTLTGAGTKVLTAQFAIDIPALTTAGTTNVGVRCTAPFVYPPTVVTVTSNAATIPVTCRLAKLTNSSAATMTFTLATTNALDGQELFVRVYDATNATAAISFTNSETGKAGAPPTPTFGSTTIPTTYRFVFNSTTSKWTYAGP